MSKSYQQGGSSTHEVKSPRTTAAARVLARSGWLVGLVACGGASAHPPATHASPAPPASAPSDVEALRTQPMVDAPAPELPTFATPPLYAVISADASSDDKAPGFFPLPDRAFFVVADAVGEVLADDVSFDPALSFGIADLEDKNARFRWFGRVTAMGGAWPHATWMNVLMGDGRTGATHLLGWNHAKSKWRLTKTSEVGSEFFPPAPWSQGRLLTIENGMQGYRFRVVQGPATSSLPQPTRSTEAHPVYPNRVAPFAFASFASGHVVVVGVDARVNTADDAKLPATPLVERWQPGDTNATLQQLPLPPAWSSMPTAHAGLNGMLAVSPNEIYVYGATTELGLKREVVRELGPYLAYFNGSSWAAIDVPSSLGVQQVQADAEGALWLSMSTVAASSKTSYLLRRSKDGAWSKLTLSAPPPPPTPAGKHDDALAPVSFWPRAKGEFWILAARTRWDDKTNRAESSTYTLFHTRPPTREAKVPELQALKEARRSVRLPEPATARCSTPFAMLYTLARNAPKGYDYPATRAALKGHSEFAKATFREFEVEGRRYFGASVADVAMGKQMLEVVTKGVPGAKPFLECRGEDLMPNARTVTMELTAK